MRLHSKPHVLVLGGNFAGLTTAQFIRERCKDDVQITLIDRKPSNRWKNSILGYSVVRVGGRYSCVGHAGAPPSRLKDSIQWRSKGGSHGDPQGGSICRGIDQARISWLCSY